MKWTLTFIFMMGTAHAADKLPPLGDDGPGVNSPLFCQLYAREKLKWFAGGLDEVDQRTIEQGVLEQQYDDYFYMCIDNPQQVTLPKEAMESDERFLAHMYLSLHKIGEAPATGRVVKTIPIIVKPDPVVKSTPVVKATPVTKGATICGRRTAPPDAAGTPARAKWCGRNYRSFNPKTGTVLCPSKKQAPCA